MSDQIKTQHGTIGLLMAECEQLRRDRAELVHIRAELEIALAKAIEVPVQERLDECEAELAQVKAEKSEVVRGFDLVQGLYRGVKEAIAAQGEEIDRLKAENERLNEQLESHAWEVSPAMAQARIDQLQAENARLAASFSKSVNLLRNIVSNLHCNEDIDQELYDAAEFLKGTIGSTPDRPAITN